MKKQKKLIITLLIMIVITLINASKVSADPNSSKGFAEFTQEQAAEETKQLEEQQREELQQSIGKSTNNFLENLEVEGYTLSPQFDKQTIEYTLNEKPSNNEINIIATPSDEKATIQGAGKVKIDENNQFRIDVTAESRNSKNIHNIPK